MTDLQSAVNELFQDWLNFDPARRTLNQLPGDHTTWRDISPEGIAAEKAFLVQALDDFESEFVGKELPSLDRRLLELVTWDLKVVIRQLDYDHIAYAAVPMAAEVSAISQVLAAARLHQPEDFVVRLEALGAHFDAINDNLKRQLSDGVVPPAQAVTRMAAGLKVMLKGHPFEESEESARPLRQLEKLTDNAELRARAEAALQDQVGPAIKRLIETVTSIDNAPDEDIGVHRVPQGSEYYLSVMKHHTQTDWSPEEIHERGKQEVSKTRARVEEVMHEVGFNGEVDDFFEFMRTSEEFQYGEGDEARAKHLAYTQGLLKRVKGMLPDYFNTLPKAECVVERMPEMMEASDFPIAMAQPAPPDGSRPGKHLLNQSKMVDHATYIQDALLVHESLPGHVMQFAVAQESERVNDYQRLRPYDTAYAEGWALYCETLADEMGVYQSPYDRYGWYTMDLWRCCRLVVDTGMHALGWTRQQAIDYMMENTSLPLGQIENEVDRYAEWPAQALGYKIGAIRMMEIRQMAEERLGDQFDIREFHDEVLVNGPLPIPMLEEAINQWCDSKQAN